MSGLNKVMLLGNLGQDPELKTTPSGQPVLNLRLATTESYLDQNKQRQERTDWHTVVIWGNRGKALAGILQKGAQIFVEGRIQTRSYEKNGEKRYATDIVATNVVLAGRAPGARAESGATTPSNSRNGWAPPPDAPAGGEGADPETDELPF